MIALGISDSITSGAALAVDGKILAAVNEERLNRQKMSMGFPELSIQEVIRLSGVRPSQVDRVAVATKTLFWRPESVPFNDYFRKKKGGYWDAFLNIGSAFSTVLGNSDFARKSYQSIKSVICYPRHGHIKTALKEKFKISAPVSFIDHHFCHATAAYYTSGFDRALVFTMDGAGDGKCSRVYKVYNGQFEEMDSLDSYHSVGNYYAYITHLCGFKAHKHEGKITGLAAYGKPIYENILRKYISYGNGNIVNTGKCFDHSAIKKLEKDLPPAFSKEDLSASIQKVLEESATSFCERYIKISGESNLALAGGVFANVKLNQRLHEIKSVKNIFIHPGMGDEGLAFGAALCGSDLNLKVGQKSIMKDVYLGAEFTDKEITQTIEKFGFKPQELDKPLEMEVAELLAQGKVVARFDGRMEYGPRALGNRTIMYQPIDPSVNDWLNKKLARTEFMPFAPVTLWEEREKCYKNIKGAAETARFMTITFDCTEWMKKSCPAVCHVDGTARPQLIREEDNPSYYRIIKHYHGITGLPTIVNTSFNMHEEPIVNSPEDALRSFVTGTLDYLVIGDHLIKYEDKKLKEREIFDTDDIAFDNYPSLQEL